jgi:hypothetical protein
VKAGRGPWPTLEIAPTSEVRDIRRAYARLLKKIDVEAEPERFVVLREAFEQALTLAQAGAIHEPIDQDPVFTLGEDVRWSSFEQPESEEPGEQLPPSIAAPPPADDSPERQAAIERANMHAEALEKLVLSQEHDTVFASRDEAAMMFDHWEAIVADPRWEELGHYAQAEAWLSEILARGCPFSDPLIPVIANHFGWITNAETLGQSPAVRFVVNRYVSLVFVEAISRKSHSLHRAWIELTKPANSRSRRGWVQRKSIEKLLGVIRRDHPALEGRLDSWRVSLWEDPSLRLGWGSIWLIVFVAFNLLRLCAASTNAPLPISARVTVAADGLNMANQDIDRVIRALSGDHLNAAMVDHNNPALYDDLLKQWHQMSSNGSNFWDFQADVSEALDRRFRHVYDKAPYKQIAAIRQIELELAQYYRNVSVAACSGYFNGTVTGIAYPTALMARKKNGTFDILLYAGADRPGHLTKSFPIPPAILSKALSRSSMSRADYLAGMRGEGTAQQRCDARIAFLKTVLAEPPRQALTVLQNM